MSEKFYDLLITFIMITGIFLAVLVWFVVVYVIYLIITGGSLC